MDIEENELFEQALMSQIKGKLSEGLKKSIINIATQEANKRFPNHPKQKEMIKYALDRTWVGLSHINLYKKNGERHNIKSYCDVSAWGACVNIAHKYKKNLI